MSRVVVQFTEEHDFDWYADRLGEGVYRKPNDGYFACPVHGGSDSLHVWEDERGVGVYCFGCGASRADIDEALGEAPIVERIVSSRAIKPWVRGPVVARYLYRDGNSELRYRKNRHEPKAFSIQRPVFVPARSEGPIQHEAYVSWLWGLGDVTPVPYNLPEVVKADELFIVGGEKDADALTAPGVVATCSPFGEMNWPESAAFIEPFVGKRITIVADRDETGYRAAAQLAEHLGTVASVRVVEARVGKDAYDHLNAGYGIDGFVVIRDA